MMVADFGSGSGAYVREIASVVGPEGRVYAIDVQQDLLRRIKNDAHARGHANVQTIWCDLEKPNASKIAPLYIDKVIIANMLFQVPDKLPPLREAHRILKPDGKMIVIDWSESFSGIGPHKKDVVKREVAIENVDAAGFIVEHEFRAGAHHYGLICRKK